MRIWRVLWFLAHVSLKNRLRMQLKRLQRPRYLAAFVVGIAYFWFFFGRRFWAMQAVSAPPEIREVVIVAASLMGLGIALVGWIVGRDRAALNFTEAEIQLLFPGPVGRPSLLFYKIARSLLLLLFSSIIATLLFGMRVAPNGFAFLLGAWLALGTMSLHETATSLSREALRVRGRSGTGLLIGGLVSFIALIGGLAWWSWLQVGPLPQSARDLAAIGAWVSSWRQTPLGIALYPVRAPLEVAFAPDIWSLLRALPSALALWAVHLVWVLRSDVAFEEASVAEAEKRAKERERRKGRGLRAESPRRSFRLKARGRAQWALTWKALIATRRLLLPQMLSLLFPVGGIAVVFTLMVSRTDSPLGWNGAAALGLAFAAGAVTVLGPNAVRSDFRLDQPQMDILKTYPLSGAQVVAGEIFGPLTLLTAVQWLLLVSAVLLSAPIEVAGFPLPLRLAVVLSAVLIAPMLTLSGLLVQNAAVLAFPSWMATGVEQARGLEAFGQRLLTFVGSLLVWFVALVPAGIIGGIVLAILWLTVGPIGAPVAALVAAGILAVECFFAIRLLGTLFDRYDLTNA